MNNEDIIRWAKEAGMHYREIEDEFHSDYSDGVCLDQLERLATLVVNATIKASQDYKLGYADGVFAEREACINVIMQTKFSNWFEADCIRAIRARETT